MIIKISKKILSGAALSAIAITALFVLANMPSSGAAMFAGGSIKTPYKFEAHEQAVVANPGEGMENERYKRPSKQLPYPNEYSFSDFEKEYTSAPVFDNAENALLAYYGILREASNMIGYSGGCGSIGYGLTPYKYAYELFSPQKQKSMDIGAFIDSFKGIGHITLLKLLPAYTPENSEFKYYMVELEAITGQKTEEQNKGSGFAYYYGLAEMINTANGWKINGICMIPEDFLCAPEHGWSYMANAVVQIVYGDNLKLVDKIDEIKQEGDIITVFASGNGARYKFEFVRITNGYDILLHEYIFENESWKETSLLSDKWKNIKLSPEAVKSKEYR